MKEKPRKTMRIYEETIDLFLNLIGELVVVGEMYSHIQKRISSEVSVSKALTDFKKNNDNFSELSMKLQQSVIDLRRVSIKSLLQRAPLVVHDIANRQAKKIKVLLKGEDIYIDKVVLEKLENSFIHLIRNAVDHGIEDAQTRLNKGKQEVGEIVVSAKENEKTVFLSIVDDGKGLDRRAISKKAINLGLISAAEIDLLSENEINQFVFEAGFSTANEVTDISGRGVGLDVVKKSVDAMGGSIRIESIKEKSTEFLLEIPKTVAINIVEGFLVGVGTERYILPMKNVGETFLVLPGMVSSLASSSEVVLFHSKTFPVVCLASVLGLDDRHLCDKNNCVGVIINLSRFSFVCLVDEVLGVQQVVVKDIKGLEGKKSIVLGGAVLGDEKVAIVLNPEEIACNAR